MARMSRGEGPTSGAMYCAPTMPSTDVGAQFIAPDVGPSPLDILASLVGSSLVAREEPGSDGQPRYRLLETIRQFAADRPAESGETARARNDHLAWCIQL